MIVRNKQTV